MLQVILHSTACCFIFIRDNPPGRECSIATQELLRLVETNPDGLEAIDPVKDLNMRDIDFIEKFRRSQFLEQSLQTFQCVHSPHFVEAVSAGML